MSASRLLSCPSSRQSALPSWAAALLEEARSLDPDAQASVLAEVGTRRMPASALRRLRDLTTTNKVPGEPSAHIVGVRLVDRRTGEVLEVDRQAARLARMRRRVASWSSTMADYLQSVGHGWRLVMIGLTYADGADWRPRDITVYLRRLRRHVGDAAGGYCWGAEVQERGAPHYHVMVLVREGTDIPLPDASGMWEHGSSNVKSARSPWYLLKYLGKEHQKEGLPKGARLFGLWIRPGLVGRMALWLHRLSAFPTWLAETLRDAVHEVKRAEGGGWLVDGQARGSPFVLCGFMRT